MTCEGKKKHMSTDMLEIETRPGRGGPTEHIYDLARGLGANQRWLVFTLHMYSYCLLFPPLVHFWLIYFGCGTPTSMIGENRQLVTNEPVEFEK